MRISSQVSAVLKIKFLSIFVYVTAPTPSRLLLHLSPLKLPNAFQVNNCDIEPFLSLFSSFCLFVVVVVVLGGNKTCRCLHGSRVCKTFQWRERAAGRNRARQTLTVGGRRERKTESVWWRGWGRKSGGNERERVGGLRETE